MKNRKKERIKEKKKKAEGKQYRSAIFYDVIKNFSKYNKKIVFEFQQRYYYHHIIRASELLRTKYQSKNQTKPKNKAT